MARLGLVAVGSAFALTLGARDANACSQDACADSNRFVQFEPVSEVIPSDGVVVFHARRNNVSLSFEDYLPYVSVSVSEGGVELAGTLEAPPSPWHGLAWRPDTPFSGGEELEISVTVDNDALGAAHDEAWIAEAGNCAASITETYSTSVSTDALSAFGLGPAVGEQEVHTTYDIALSSLVCCDGAMPTETSSECGTTTAVWAEGQCHSLSGTGRLMVTMSVPMPDALEAADVVLSMVVDGEARAFGFPGEQSLRWSQDSPFCARLQARSLSRGDTWDSEELCFGDDVADQIGPVTFDPSEELAAQCVDDPYVCEVTADGSQWDEAACTAWMPDGEDESGDGDGGDDDGDDDGDDGADGGGDTGGEDDGGDVGQDGGEDDGVSDGGCSCTASRSDAPAGWAVFALGLGLIGRRRRRG